MPELSVKSQINSLKIGFLLFPHLTQLDLTGPYEAFARIPHAQVHLIWKDLQPVVSDRGMAILPSCTFTQCPALAILCIPGGPGQVALMDDLESLNFIRLQAQQVKYLSSVCTGALVLGAAGLLKGYRATTHWSAMGQLALFGAEPVAERVVQDRYLMTGAGVSAGLDFALQLVATLCGEERAKMIQLQMEYDPMPPFQSGRPALASAETLAAVTELTANFKSKRWAASVQAAEALARTDAS